MRKKSIVRLTSDERVDALEVVGKLKGTSQNVRRAQILFKADADGPDWTDAEIAEAFSCRTRTVERLRQRLCEQVFEAALDAEADDFAKVVDQYEITCTPAKFNGLQDALLKAKYEFVEAELKCIPKAAADVDVELGKRIVRIMDKLEENEDVQNVYTNANLTAEMME